MGYASGHNAVNLIRKKRDGGTLSEGELHAFVRGAAAGTWPDYQLSALLMAIWLRGMTTTETATLTRLMADSGRRLDWSHLPGPTADKHSTGGVGDKTSLILAPLVAACGVFVPMMSGRGLGHTGGTLDKLEAIPGFRVSLDEAEMDTALRTVGAALVGQTAAIAPADRVLYALRDVTGTVESIPLITASILSKKLAEGTASLVLDVKFGGGAFMADEANATALAQSLLDNGSANGLNIRALLTRMDSPLGTTVGHTLELIECAEILKGNGEPRLTGLSVTLAGHMLVMAGVANDLPAAETRIRTALASGAGFEKFRQIIAQQGGDPHVLDDYARLPTAPHRTLVTADQTGYLVGYDARTIAEAVLRLGGGRTTVADRIDSGVGVRQLTLPGTAVRPGQALLEVHYSNPERWQAAAPLFTSVAQLRPEPTPVPPLIQTTLRKDEG